MICGENPVSRFKVTNQSKNKLRLIKMDSTCKCSLQKILLPSDKVYTPNGAPDEILCLLNPKETAQFTVKLKSTEFTGSDDFITLHTDDPQNPSFSLSLKGRIIPAFTFEPKRLDFDAVKEGSSARKTMIIRSAGAGDFEILDIEGLPPYITYNIEKIEKTQTPSVILSLIVGDDAPPCSKNIKLTGRVKSEKVEEFDLYLFLEVMAKGTFDSKSFHRAEEPPVIECKPDALDFGEVLSGEVITKEIRITNQGQGDLALLRITFTCGCTVPRILMPSGEVVVPDKKGETKVGVLLPGESAVLELEYSTLGYQGVLKRMLTIFSNDPQKREFKIPIESIIKPSFEFEPSRFVFGDIPKSEGTTRSMIIRSMAAGDFDITGIEKPKSYLDYTVEKYEEGGLVCARLDLTFKKNAPAGSKSEKLKFKVKSDRVKEFNVYAYANILAPLTFKCDALKGKGVLDFGVLEAGQGGQKVIEIINHNPDLPYNISAMEFESSRKEYFVVKLITLEEGMHYRIRITVSPKLTKRFFHGTIRLISDHPDLKVKEISIKGWISQE